MTQGNIHLLEDPRSRIEKASYLRWKDGKATGCTLGGQHPGGRSKEAVKGILRCFGETCAWSLPRWPGPASHPSLFT